MSDEFPPDAVDPIADEPRKRRGGCLAGCLIAVPVAYALSPPFVIIPLLLLERLGWDAAVDRLGNAVEVMYLPLNWLNDRFEFVAKFYDWYMGLFERWLG